MGNISGNVLIFVVVMSRVDLLVALRFLKHQVLFKVSFF